MTSVSITMNIPADREDQVRRLLERLDMKDENIIEQNSNSEDHYEVSKITNHKIDKKGFSWLVNFKAHGYKDQEWVRDEDCNCEKKIQEYLCEHAHRVRTVYGLCRVSTKNQTGPTHVSLAAQESRIRQKADVIDLEPNEIMRVKIFSIAASAYRGIPKQLVYISQCARPGDILITYRVDRLSRNIVRFLSLLEDMNDAGVLIYAQDEDLWYHHRKLDFLQCILDANKEAAVIGKRVRLSLEHRRKRGDYIGSAPYGWRLSRDPITRAIKKERNPEEMKIIDRIRKNREYDHGAMADLLNREGLFKRGRKWKPSMIKYVLNN